MNPKPTDSGPGWRVWRINDYHRLQAVCEDGRTRWELHSHVWVGEQLSEIVRALLWGRQVRRILTALAARGEGPGLMTRLNRDLDDLHELHGEVISQVRKRKKR